MGAENGNVGKKRSKSNIGYFILKQSETLVQITNLILDL